MRVTKAITVQQPWAELIGKGVKLVENRGRNTTYRGPLAIHAGSRWSKRGAHDERVMGALGGLPTYDTLPTGVIIAVADLVDCHQSRGSRCCHPWGETAYVAGTKPKATPKPCFHLVLADVVRLPEPIPMPGQLSVPWNLPDGGFEL